MTAGRRAPLAEGQYREGKLAETAPNRPLLLTIGAAAVTLLVVLGVLTGPSVATCFNSPEGMGQCLRGKMAEAGLVPAATVPETADAEVAEEPTAQVAALEEAIPDEPALDVTPPAEVDAAAAENVITATFGLLRAEPDGSVVIAGSGTPGSEVEVFANGEKLGATTVEQSGDWVFVPDAPLPPGGLEITLGEAGKAGQSDEAFIVVINEDKTSQPLVVASTPGQASEVLQGLEQPVQTAAVAPEQSAVQAPSAEAPAVEAAQAGDAVPAGDAAAPEPAAPAAETAEAPADASADPVAADEPVAATVSDEPAVDEPAVAEDAVEPAATTEVAAQPEAPEAPAEPIEAVPAVTETEAEVAAVTPTEPPAAPLTAAWTSPTIDAIEIEGERSFFAGAGPDGGVIRLYVDDTFVADAPVEGGRWLIEGGAVLTKPNQRIRADLLAPGSADVVGRSEVDFVVELPATDAPVAVADAPQVNDAGVAAADPEPQAPVAEPAAVSSEPAAPAPEPPAPEIAATEAPAVEPVADSASAATPTAVSAEAEPAVTEPTPAAEPEPVAAIADAPSAADEPAMVTDEAPAVPTLVAVSVGDPEAQRFASGKAIIRRGDNLWTIARRVYGEGIKYTTIYEANTGQIRDPDRIYPGQVFSLPTGQ